jgi:hypothetical protein
MTLYLLNDKSIAWMPPSSTGMVGTWGAVLVPSQQEIILNRSQYLELLALRVEWLLQEWMDAEELTPKQALNLLRKYLDDRQVNSAAILPPQLNDSAPLNWAKALTVENQELWEKFCLQTESNFPIQPNQSDPAEQELALGLIEEISLEEWLQLAIIPSSEG